MLERADASSDCITEDDGEEANDQVSNVSLSTIGAMQTQKAVNLSTMKPIR